MVRLIPLIFFLLGYTNIFGQDQSGLLSNQETDSLVLQYCVALDNTYFNKTKSTEIIDVLKNKLKKGDFYNVTQLTDRLSLLVRELTNDIHFYIGKSIDEEKLNTSKKDEIVFDNSGFAEARVIEKSIGYIKWNEFIADDVSFAKAINALNFINGCKYLIFDISECPGGDGRIGGFVLRHLFENDDYQDLLVKKCTGDIDWVQSEVAYHYTNGPKFHNIPIYVITSKNTGSAAEYFALTLSEMKRATLLGANTAGAGNPVTIVYFGNYFAYIPICEIETKDGKSIEGKGVRPDYLLSSKDWVNETVEFIKKHH